ncbi:MAG: hypothetical protein O7C75_02710 [Verrucomicrobia bacterium]|nr:hypothetical protein [Verrucomicrobiota bacterium]
MDSKTRRTEDQKLEQLVEALTDKPELTQRLLSIAKLARGPDGVSPSIEVFLPLFARSYLPRLVS